MVKNISSFEDIENNLKILKLRREIALEEIKVAKQSVANGLNPMEWINSGFIKSTGKLGILFLLKKYLKKRF